VENCGHSDVGVTWLWINDYTQSQKDYCSHQIQLEFLFITTSLVMAIKICAAGYSYPILHPPSQTREISLQWQEKFSQATPFFIQWN